MKKLTSLAIVIILMLGILPTAQASEYMNVYSLDGRVEVISTSDFDAWHAVGWYSAPVMYVYAIDGRSEIILKSDFSKWQAVGWYSAPMMYVYAADGRRELIPQADYSAWNSVGWYSDIPIMVYAPDGRSQYIPKNEFPQWQSAGWYSAPVMYMYTPDGRVQLILKNEMAKWQKSGWYTKPVITIYSGSKSKVVPREDFVEWRKAGWDAYVKLSCEDGYSISVLTQKLDEDYYYYYYNGCRYGTQQGSLDAPISIKEWSPNGTNVTIEQAKEIVRKYARNNFHYTNGLRQLFDEYNGYGWWERTDDIFLADYSDTAYLFSISMWDGSEFVSVNKTTGYIYYCGGGCQGYTLFTDCVMNLF